MARVREFDPKAALHKAMLAFWRNGYANTSIEDLVNATGVNRHGLYDEFESKHGLFLACLDHYQDTVVETAFGVVEQPGASLKNVRAYFRCLLDSPVAEYEKLGCLMVNTASEVAPYDKRAAGRVEKFRQRLQRGFTHALANAKAGGEIAARLNIARTADFLIGVVQGLSVMSRSNADPKMLANVFETALTCLK